MDSPKTLRPLAFLVMPAGTRGNRSDFLSSSVAERFHELKQPRLIDVMPIQFVGGEPVQPERKPSRRFRGQLIYFTSADVTVRRRSGAIVVIDSYEIVAISDGKVRFEPR